MLVFSNINFAHSGNKKKKIKVIRAGAARIHVSQEERHCTSCGFEFTFFNIFFCAPDQRTTTTMTKKKKKPVPSPHENILPKCVGGGGLFPTSLETNGREERESCCVSVYKRACVATNPTKRPAKFNYISLVFFFFFLWWRKIRSLFEKKKKAYTLNWNSITVKTKTVFDFFFHGFCSSPAPCVASFFFVLIHLFPPLSLP